MKLSKQTDYSFKVLIYLFSKGKDDLVLTKDIASFYDISLNHITKVVAKLSALGFVVTTRGRYKSGIKLAMPAKSIKLGTIIKLFEKGRVASDSTYNDEEITTSHQHLLSKLAKGNEAYLSNLEKYTLWDICSANKSVQQVVA